MDILRTALLFIVAGLCEIGGGYLVWLWLREGRPVWYGIAGGLILALYGVVATLQRSDFAKVYATYGGVFIVMSLVWAHKVDNYSPTKYDIIGALIALLGVVIIYYAPKN
jgi:small multidrug resistance family-3 protein